MMFRQKNTNCLIHAILEDDDIKRCHFCWNKKKHRFFKEEIIMQYLSNSGQLGEFRTNYTWIFQLIN
jgi:hypothetical protein